MQASESRFETNGFQSPGLQSMSSDLEIGMDPASSMIFCSDFQKNEDIRRMLDSNKDNLKLTAMRRVIAMVAKGKECSDLFPAIVKNVVSKDPEVRKLVYVYLTRYAEEQQDLALLSISTFQRSLKDANQLIRASALRVLSSIRIPVIAPILMLAVRDGAVDLSPYVRKAVAHAIPKLYRLDPEEKDSLVELIIKLLEDKSTVVAGSAVQALEEVCPERLDLIHKHYRKLCNLLMDVDEWGQIAIINMLTRYARTQFPDPKTYATATATGMSGSEVASSNLRAKTVMSPDGEAASARGADDAENASSGEESEERRRGLEGTRSGGFMDPAMMEMLRADYRLLITATRLLLHSHNPGVVVAVAQLYYHCAPKEELHPVVKALIRILHSTKEIEHVVLSNIASMSLLHPGLFEPHLRTFFVFNSDTAQVKLLKLEILTNLVNPSTSSIILREFQAYVDSTDRGFVLATVQCIGRCASMVPQIAETCLTGLLRLMSRKNESLVAESVVVMRKLLQMQYSAKESKSRLLSTTDHKDVIVHIAQMVEEITIPSARASILWLLGEYGHRVPKIAPDVLRKMAKSFPKEHVAVKLQVLNLAAKLCIVNPKQTFVIAQYVFTLAKYDQNYDIRDRSRYFRALIFPKTADSPKPELLYLTRNVKKILLATKPAPVLRSTFADRPTFRLGSMSQLLGHAVAKYTELPEWPLVPPDPTVRLVSAPPPVLTTTASSDHSGQTLSISQQETEEEESTEEDDDDDEEDEEEDEDEDEDGSEENEEEEEDEEEAFEVDHVAAKGGQSELDGDSLSTESDSELDELAQSHDVSRNFPSVGSPRTANDTSRAADEATGAAASEISADLLLLDFDSPPMPTVGAGRGGPPSLGDPLVPTVVVAAAAQTAPPADFLPPGESVIKVNIPAYELQPSPAWLLATPAYAAPLLVEARFTRTVSVFGRRQTNLELRLTNRSIAPRQRLRRIRPVAGEGPGGQSSRPLAKSAHCVEPFAEIDSLEVDASVNVFIGVDFCNSTQPLRLGLRYQLDNGAEVEEQAGGKKQCHEEVTHLEINPPVGELLQPLDIGVREFISKQASLRGMQEITKTFSCASDRDDLVGVVKRIVQRANLGLVGAFSRTTVEESGVDVFSGADCVSATTRILRLAGDTTGADESGSSCCLLEVTLPPPSGASGSLRVHTEAIALGLQLADELASCLSTGK